MPYTKKAMQQRFANRTYMRTDQDIEFDPLKQACLAGQVQLQIKSPLTKRKFQISKRTLGF